MAADALDEFSKPGDFGGGGLGKTRESMVMMTVHSQIRNTSSPANYEVIINHAKISAPSNV